MGTTEAGELIVVVSDAGPLIHLDELECLDLLAAFSQVLVPRRVWEEVGRHRGGIDIARVPGGLVVEAPENASPRLISLGAALGLGDGERDAIAVLSQRGQLLLCDDAAARLAAESLGFIVRGTLGLIVRSIRQGVNSRSDVLKILADLPTRSTLHVSKSLLKTVIADVERESLPE